MHEFYVYAYLRTTDSVNGLKGSPYYIGKGRKDRAYSSNHRVKPPRSKDSIVFLSTDMSEIDAYQAEMFLISQYGRIDLGTGCLRNGTDGGDGVKVWVPSQEYRDNVSVRMKRILEDPNERVKRSKHFKELWNDPSYKERIIQQRLYAWSNSPERKEAVSSQMTALWSDPTYLAKMEARKTKPVLVAPSAKTLYMREYREKNRSKMKTYQREYQAKRKPAA